MLKSLFSGVTGLQSHQIAMDVESNNIANVNTIGYKYSRANFADLLAQTNKIATAPQGDLGGKNALQVGLGTTINSVTRIHSQGSIQNTDKNTDVAIQGDGFFIVSPDGGNTYKYSRSGDFKFDANGNFVDNNGFIVQGWLRDETTGVVDSTAPIQDIRIPPGLTTPANASTGIDLKANLNSGILVEQFVPTFSIDSTGAFSNPNAFDEDLGFMFNGGGEAFSLVDGQTLTIDVTVGGAPTSLVFEYDGNLDGVTAPNTAFRTVEELRAALAAGISGVLTGAGAGTVDVSVNDQGKYVIDPALATTDFSLNVADGDNEKFTEVFATLTGGFNAGGSERQTLSVNAAAHSSSIDIFDSLGSKHTAKIDFRKVSTGNWDFNITVENPATITGANILTPNVLTGGTISFDSNGGLLGFSPPSFDIDAHNGSAAPQTVALNFGTPNGGFDGVTSFDNPSATSGISQDGYPGGDLVGIRIDQSGTLIGSFSNGRSFGLAQISMAKFANNEGLVSEGGNVYTQSANSGDPIIGTASTAGRGFIQSSALEASNVDLSKALTQLIIIQRGYQANGKTITTSDTLLETLIGLKR